MVYLKTEQVLLPRQVYIGDRAEIRCTFETDSPGIRNEIAQKGVRGSGRPARRNQIHRNRRGERLLFDNVYG